MNLAKFHDIYGQYPFNPPEDTQPLRTILITGAGGMIGHGLAVTIREMQKIGALSTTNIFLASRRWTDHSRNFWEHATSVNLILNTEIKNLGTPPDLVIHTASPSNLTQIKSLEELLEINSGMANDILALNPGRIVYISSGEVYGGISYQESRIDSQTTASVPRNWYAIAKIRTENLLLEKENHSKTSIAIIRLFHTFGPGVKKDDGRSFADIIWAAAQGHEITLHSRGTQIRTFLYLADAIDAILKVALKESPVHDIYNIGSTEPHQIIEFARVAANLEGLKVRTIEKAEYLHSPLDSVTPTLSNIIETGWKSNIEVAQGIRLTIDWAKKNL